MANEILSSLNDLKTKLSKDHPERELKLIESLENYINTLEHNEVTKDRYGDSRFQWIGDNLGEIREIQKLLCENNAEDASRRLASLRDKIPPASRLDFFSPFRVLMLVGLIVLAIGLAVTGLLAPLAGIPLGSIIIAAGGITTMSILFKTSEYEPVSEAVNNLNEAIESIQTTIKNAQASNNTLSNPTPAQQDAFQHHPVPSFNKNAQPQNTVDTEEESLRSNNRR